MNWSSLKNFKCPKCLGDLERGETLHTCESCDFRIGTTRFDQIVNGMHNPKKNRFSDNEQEENQSDLNNLEL